MYIYIRWSISLWKSKNKIKITVKFAFSGKTYELPDIRKSFVNGEHIDENTVWKQNKNETKQWIILKTNLGTPERDFSKLRIIVSKTKKGKEKSAYGRN